MVEFVLDVTDHREAERALRECEARFRALVDASAAAVWSTDARGPVTEDSPSWRAFTGQTSEQWLGTGWLEAVHPDERARVDSVSTRAKPDGVRCTASSAYAASRIASASAARRR
jgi:PAS domain S-box-containing protein